MDQILQTRNPHNPPKNNHSPIKRLRRRSDGARPKAPKEGPNDINHRQRIDVDARFAQRPAGGGGGGVGERFFAAETFGQDAADGDGVGGHEGDDAEGDDGVEGDGGADVDEG